MKETKDWAKMVDQFVESDRNYFDFNINRAAELDGSSKAPSMEAIDSTVDTVARLFIWSRIKRAVIEAEEKGTPKPEDILDLINNLTIRVTVDDGASNE
jgi:hypothetical protein